jgi:FkbM family methyltransferase
MTERPLMSTQGAGSITLLDGLYWPADDTSARQTILRDRDSDVANMLRHTPGRDIIIQAGGNCGVYALDLAQHFNCVVTCEPDPTNWLCLAKNTEAHDKLHRVRAYYAAFGAEAGSCAPVVVSRGNCGAHRVDFSTGDVPVMTIDGLNLAACDGLWLDLEGSELFALQGAEQTICRFAPTIRVEDKGLDHRFFGTARGALQEWLGARGYVEIDRQGRDKVYRKQGA